jgi:hypothetical protein
VRRNREFLRQVAVTQDLDVIDLALDQTGTAQRFFVHLGTSIETLEIGHVDSNDHGREGHVEATLGQATLNRRLSTFEVELADVAALASLLAFHAATGGLTNSGPTPAPEPSFGVTRSSGEQ